MDRKVKRLLLDIRKYLDEWQGVNDECTKKHDVFIYAIDLVLENHHKKDEDK